MFFIAPHDTYTEDLFLGGCFYPCVVFQNWNEGPNLDAGKYSKTNERKHNKQRTTNSLSQETPSKPATARENLFRLTWDQIQQKGVFYWDNNIYIYIVTSWNQTPTTIEYRNHHLKPKHYLSIDTSHTSRLFQLSGFPVSSGIFQKSESKTIGCNFKKCGGCISHSKQIKFLKTTRLKTPVLFHSASDRCFFFPLGDVSSQLGVRFFFHPEAFGALPNNSWLGYAVYIIHYTDLEILQICYKKSFFCAFLVERN